MEPNPLRDKGFLLAMVFQPPREAVAAASRGSLVSVIDITLVLVVVVVTYGFRDLKTEKDREILDLAFEHLPQRGETGESQAILEQFRALNPRNGCRISMFAEIWTERRIQEAGSLMEARVKGNPSGTSILSLNGIHHTQGTQVDWAEKLTREVSTQNGTCEEE